MELEAWGTWAVVDADGAGELVEAGGGNDMASEEGREGIHGVVDAKAVSMSPKMIMDQSNPLLLNFT